MKFSAYVLDARHLRFGVASVAALGLVVALPFSAQAAATPVPLGTAGSFVVLAGVGISNTGSSVISGDLGLSPGAASSITGFPPGTVTGAQHAADGVALQAKTDLVTAYNHAAGQGPTSPISAGLAGRTLLPGVHKSASSIGLAVGGTLLLNAAGDPDAVFVFQAGSSLTTGSGSRVLLRNGARSCNVFWQVGSSATLGTGSTFAGTIMAQDSITVTTGAKVVGRVLARTGAVTLDTNRIIRPTPCVVGATAVVPTRTVTATPVPTPGPQVPQVPSGPVSTGDGSTGAGGDDERALWAGVLVFAGVGGAAVVAARRRRPNV